MLVLLVLRPFLFETSTVPTNSMAPTVLGRHWSASCPQCGEPAYCTPETDSRGFSLVRDVRMICENFHMPLVHPPSVEAYGPDRFLVAKFLEPRRWDLVVFRYPEDPSVFYLKRLVGLPGEEVVIKEGEVWIDGKLLTPPESIRGIKYVSKVEGWPFKQWGHPRSPQSSEATSTSCWVISPRWPRTRDFG